MSFKTLPDVQSFEGDHSLFHNFFSGFRIHVRFLYYMEINNIWEMVLEVTDIQRQKQNKINHYQAKKKKTIFFSLGL